VLPTDYDKEIQVCISSRREGGNLGDVRSFVIRHGLLLFGGVVRSTRLLLFPVVVLAG
jgi:hypothetical protein